MDNLDKELQAIINRLRQLGTSTKELEAIAASFSKIKDNTDQARAFVDNMARSTERLEDRAAFASESFASLNAIIQQNNQELGKSEDIAKKAYRAKRSIVDISQQLLADEKGINVLNEEQLRKLDKKLTDQVSTLKQQAESLLGEENLLKLQKEGFELGKNGKMLNDAALANKIRSLTLSGKLTDEQFKFLKGYSASITAEEALLDKTKARLEVEENINRKIGLTGSLINSASGAMSKLGLNSKIVSDATEKAQKKMRALATDANSTKRGIMAAGLLEMGKGLSKALMDPLTIFTFIGKSILQSSKQMASLRKQTGMSYEASFALAGEMKAFAAATGSAFITSEKLLKAYADMSKYIGQSAHILGNEALKSATYLTEKLHLSGEAAGQLVGMTRLTGRSTEDTFKNMGKVLTKFNMTNKQAFSLKDMMEAVGTASTATVLQLDKSPEALLEAAAAAKLVGLNLGQVEKIADSLLNFQSSIEAELEAQLLTGNALNLSRAREMAMMGDMKGLSEEIGKQEAIKEAFASKNVIAQNAAAKALGLSREELAKMALQQDYNNMAADEFKRKYGEVSYESLKAQSAQDKFNTALQKMQSVLGDIFHALTPIIDGFAYLVSIPYVPQLAAAAIAVKALGGSFGGVMKAGKGLLGLFTNIGKTAADTAASAAKTVSDTAAGAASQASQAGQQAAGQGGGMIERFNKLDTKSLLRGAAAMVVLSAALYISAKAFQEFADVTWESVAMGLVGLAGMAGVAKIVANASTSMIKGAAAIAILGVALIPFSYALNQMASVDIGGVLAAAGGLVIFTAAAFGLGALLAGPGAIIFGAGLLGIVALSAALVPLAAALNYAAPGLEAFGNAMSSLTMESAKALAVTGVGLIALAGGLISLSAASLLGSPLGTLSDLAALAPGLATVGTSLTAIAAGIVALSAALNSLETTKLDELKDLVITTAFAAPMVAATGAITELISGIAGSTEDSDNRKLLDKVDRLIAAVETRQNIYLNPGAIEEAIVIQSEKF